MLHLTVVAPDKRKAELDFEATRTFGDVKAKVCEAFGVPPEKQRLICSGKERKDDKETLAAAKIAAKTKVMLMLAQGYSMPALAAVEAPAADAEATSASDEASAEAEPIDAEAELPVPQGVARAEVEGKVHVRQGKNRYHVRVPQGLAAATFGELADFMAPVFFPGVPPAELRFLAHGKTPARSDVLGGAKEMTIMLLFREGYHAAEEGALWFKEHEKDLTDIEENVQKLGKKIEANLCGEETHLKLDELKGRLGDMEHSVDIVQVRTTMLPEMRSLRDRVIAALARVDDLRKSTTRL